MPDERRSEDERTDEEWLAMSDAEFDIATGDIAALLAEGPLEVEREQPSESLWAAIAAELELDPQAGTAEPEPSTVIDPIAAPTAGSASARAASRWGSHTAILTAVAAAVLLVLVPIGLATRGDDEPDVVAVAELDVLNDFSATGEAALVVDGDSPVLELELPDDEVAAVAPDDGYIELWLLHLDENGEFDGLMESLGPVDGSGRYEVPADLYDEGYRLVDLSIEHNDGIAEHSGNSILRGPLTA